MSHTNQQKCNLWTYFLPNSRGYYFSQNCESTYRNFIVRFILHRCCTTVSLLTNGKIIPPEKVQHLTIKRV